MGDEERRRVVRGARDDPALSDDELVRRRVSWFEAYASMANVVAPAIGQLYTCPCCGYATLDERGGYEICDVCGWEDDGQDDHDSHVVRGGPNGGQSLDDARAEFVAGGGVRGEHRPPLPPT